MRINNASMCMNVTRGSQYIVMHNTGATDLEISEQIDIMKVDILSQLYWILYASSYNFSDVYDVDGWDIAI